MAANSATVDNKIALDANANSRALAHAALSAGNAAAVKRYQALRKEQLAKAVSNLSGKEKEDYEALLTTKLVAYPDLKKFIDEKEKEDNEKNNLFKAYGLGLLERALFHAIEGRFVKFVKQLLALGANANVQTTPRNVPNVRDISITPLYYALVLYYSPNKLEDNTPDAVRADWSVNANNERAAIIYELITAGGAAIDSPTLLGDFGSTFLHVLALRVLEYPELLDTLNLVLACYPDVNIVDGSGQTVLAVVISHLQYHIKMVIPYLDTPEAVQKAANKTQLYKTIVTALVQNSRQDYTKVSSSHKKVFDLIRPVYDGPRNVKVIQRPEILNLPIYQQNEEMIKEIFDTILDDIAAQCLEHYYSDVTHREYRSAEHYLLAYARATYHHNNPDDPDNNYFIDQGGDEYVDGMAVHIKEKIVDRALAMMTERYALGFASVRYQNYLSPAVRTAASNVVATIPHGAAAAAAPNAVSEMSNTNINYYSTDIAAKRLWDIVTEYCYPKRLSFLIQEGRHLASHFALPPNTRAEQFLSTVTSFQIVPFDFRTFTLAVIESNPAYSSIPLTESELFARGVYSSVVSPEVSPKTAKPAAAAVTSTDSAEASSAEASSDVKADSEKRVYKYSLATKGEGGCRGVVEHHFIVQPSFQPGNTVMQCIWRGNPEPTAFLYLFKKKLEERNPQFKLKLGWKFQGFADEIDASGVTVKNHFEQKTFTALAREMGAMAPAAGAATSAAAAGAGAGILTAYHRAANPAVASVMLGGAAAAAAALQKATPN